ncbi:MAG: TolC family protein [Pelotomaculum sp.]|nr:TolC family protein [Pelotomaculum sp.]
MKKFTLLLMAIVIMVPLAALPAWAKEPATPELTLNDAVALALKNSETVKKADKEVKRTKALRDEKQDSLGYIPTGPTGNQEEAAYASLFSANLTWQMSEKSLTVEQDSVALDTCNKYWDVQLAMGALKVAEQSLKQAELDLAKARVSHRVGLISQDALLAAESKWAGAKSALEKARNDLDAAYTAFNQMVGLWPEDRPVLTDELKFIPLSDNNVEYLVAKALADSPSVWLANEKVNLQKILEEMAYYTGSYQPYEAREIELDQAKLDAVSAREATEVLVRNLFYSVRTLEENYPAAEQAVKVAEENLRVGQIKYQVGMLTKAELAALETALAQARQSLLELKKNHAYYKLALEKPWAM